MNDLSFEIPSGSIYGFIGPNGAGKTTAIRMLMGILRPDAGALTVLGTNDPRRIRPRLGYLPEERGLYKKMRVIDQVSYFARLKGMEKRAAVTRSSALLDEFGLTDWKDQKCEALSKGMAQKAQIVATLVHEPDLVVLDEPFSGLDPVNVELIRRTILDLKQTGRTVLFSTHAMDQAEQLCDALVLINHGRKILEGPLAELRAGAGNTVTLDYDGDSQMLQDLPGVTHVHDAGNRAELTLAAGIDPQRILQSLVGRFTIHRFDTAAASLHEIFLREVGPAATEDRHERRNAD